MKNREIAAIFYKIAELLSLANENSFRIRAYEKAAQAVETLSEAVEEIAKRDELKDIPGIGESTAEKIQEYLSTGKMTYLEQLEEKFPPGLIEIMSIPGMGPKKAKTLYDKLKISTVSELVKAIKQQKIRELRGFGAKVEENILKGIALKSKSGGRILLYEAKRLADEIVKELSKNKNIKQISAAGSLRRFKETVRDVDLLCSAPKAQAAPIIEQFTHLRNFIRILAAGQTKASCLTADGIQVDLRVVEPAAYGAALLYFTGSKEHNIKLRELAIKKGLTINEYGVFKIGKKTKSLAGKTEEEVYHYLGLSYIPPTLREDRGEIAVAARNKVPKLVELKDIHGDIHIHSNYSEGAGSIAEIAEKAKGLGYEWVIICDHSQSLKIARGVSVVDLHKKIREINSFNKNSRDFKILCGIELDILPDGSLDYPEEVLKKVDFVLAAIHTGFKQTEAQITARIVKALQNPYVDALAHPSGRLLNRRDAYPVNMEKVLEVAAQNHKILEVNVFPERLDLSDIYCRKAKEIGVTLAMGTDAHAIDHMYYMAPGVGYCQRGWLEKRDILNCLSYKELLKTLHLKS